MRCYGAMLSVVQGAGAEPPEADSWAPLQEGFFGAFESFCACARDVAGRLIGEAHGGGDERAPRASQPRPDGGGGGKATDAGYGTIYEEDDEDLSAAAESDEDIGEMGNAELEDARQSGKSVLRGGEVGRKSAAAAAVRAGRGLVSDDAKLLAVMSNATALRGRVLPSLAELHRLLLVRGKRGEAELQQRLEAASSALGQLVAQLLQLYLVRAWSQA